MKKQQISRRQFLSLTALSGTGLLLAACGGQTAVPEATAVIPPTTAPAAAGANASGDIKIMAKDVLDFALETDDWSGLFGWVKFRLNEGRHNGEPIYFIRTDASDKAYADENGLVFVPLLNQGSSIAKPLYVFNDDTLPVLGSAPSDDDYISLFHIIEVEVSDPRADTESAEGVETAVADGRAEVTETGIYVNFPVVKWAGGSMDVDDELTASLGKGQLVEPVDTAAMTVSLKLHQCFPGSRYILTDTSSVGMAPMMSVPASTPAQALMDSGGTDEIWIFVNGIPGSGVMGFQPAIFDNEAGQPAWSPFWNHFALKWVDESNARVVRSSAEVRELLASGELEQFNGVPDSHPNGFVVNCPAPLLAPNTFEG